MKKEDEHSINILFIIAYIILFFIVFGVAFYGYVYNTFTVDFGITIPAKSANLVIMAISFIGIVKSFWHIYRY